jgi:ParB family transcriptional regulator, chromosome partitioning protein
MPLQLDDLAGLDEPSGSPQGQGRPLMLPIELIDEDPDQPRREFDADALQELADTIRERGVRQPISVRPHPNQPDRWMLNFGARRLRASKLASKETIPAFVDSTADSYDQVIENEQRESLRPIDLALFVERRLALNESQNEIARKLGKSQSYVACASALIDAPDWLMALYREGRCQGMTELYLLRRLHAEAPDAVLSWLARHETITRAGLQGLKLALSQAAPQPTPAPAPTPARPIDTQTSSPTPSFNAINAAPLTQSASRQQTIGREVTCLPSTARLLAHWRETLVEVVTDQVPRVSGAVFVKSWPTTDNAVEQVAAGELKLFGFEDTTSADRQANCTRNY